MGFEELVHGARVTRPFDRAKTAAELASRQRSEAEARAQAADTELSRTWRIASNITRLLTQGRIDHTDRMVASKVHGAYRYMGAGNIVERAFAKIIAGRGVGVWNMHSTMTTHSTVQDSDVSLNFDLYLGEDKTIYGTRGMTNWERKQGLLAPEITCKPNSSFPNVGNVLQIQQGLANLVAQYELPLDEIQ